MSRAMLQVARQRRKFEANGFLVLPRFFGDAVIDEVIQCIDQVKRDRPMDVVIDDLETGARSVLGLLTARAVSTARLKINDLFLGYPVVRDLALAPPLVPVLQALLGQAPVLCNSLYLGRGSAQAPHVDTLYMTPRTPGHLIASWVALETAHVDAGPLEYWPGSHRIAPMRFSNGSFHAVPTEMPAWEGYMQNQVQLLGLKKAVFTARRGDVFIWHASLLHGGGPINDPARSRKSLVFHYYSEADARLGDDPVVPQNGAYWMSRAKLPLPDAVARSLPFSETAYLARYADVAQAVRAGGFPSGQAHYEAYGRQEGRLPA